MKVSYHKHLNNPLETEGVVSYTFKRFQIKTAITYTQDVTFN